VSVSDPGFKDITTVSHYIMLLLRLSHEWSGVLDLLWRGVASRACRRKKVLLSTAPEEMQGLERLDREMRGEIRARQVRNTVLGHFLGFTLYF
jgi:hypothetical protein